MMFTDKKKILFLLLSLGGFLSASGQYYYQDIYRTFETNRQHQQYRSNRIREIRIRSFDAQNSPNNDFQCKKTFTDDYRKTITDTRSFSTGTDHLVSLFDKKGRVIHTIDSAAVSISHTWIHYDPRGKIDSLVFLSYAPENGAREDTLLHPNINYRLKETHVYHYDTSGTLIKMERLKNQRPYSTIYFTVDSAGRIFKEYEKDSRRPAYYYKYNANGRLSDLFHYNNTKKRMVPDYLFNYDDQGRLAQKTVVIRNSHDYLQWQYFYDGKGNIQREKCYKKENELQGSLLFKYEYLP